MNNKEIRAFNRSVSPNSVHRPSRKKGKVSKVDKLKSAAIMGDISMIQSLLKEDSAFTESRDDEGNSPLHHCSEHGHLSLVKLLIDKKANVNALNISLSSPIHVAAVNGNSDILSYLLYNNADINHSDFGGLTALHWSVIFKKPKCIKLLLKQNADIEDEDKKGCSPLHLAVVHGKESIINILLKYKADINHKTSSEGHSPLHIACANNRCNIVDLLLDKKANPNIINLHGDSPLHSAVKRNSIPMVQKLLDCNANPDIVNNQNNTPRVLTNNETIKRLLSARTIFIEDDWCIVEDDKKGNEVTIIDAFDDKDKSNIVEQFGQLKKESTYVHILDGGEISFCAGLKSNKYLQGSATYEESLICPILVRRATTRPIIKKLAQFLSSKLNSENELSQLRRSAPTSSLLQLNKSYNNNNNNNKKQINKEKNKERNKYLRNIDIENTNDTDNIIIECTQLNNTNPYQPLSQPIPINSNSPYENINLVQSEPNSKTLLTTSDSSPTFGYHNLNSVDSKKLYSSADSIESTISISNHVSPLRTSADGISCSFPNLSKKRQDKRLIALLEDLGLEQYIDTFIEEEWDWEALMEITNTDLMGLGIKSGSRRKLISAIAKFRELESEALDNNITKSTPNLLHTSQTPFSGFISPMQVTHLKNTCNYIINFSEITKNRYLGKGFYGEVFLGFWNGVNVAVKQMTRPVDSIQKWLLEIELLHKLRHPNIVMFYGACIDPPNYCIVLEYVSRGSLESVLLDVMVQIDHEKRLKILCDIARGMKYLHSQNPPILHRDLKSDNVLIDEHWNAKVSDFGLSRYKDETYSYGKATTPFDVTITPFEVLQNNHRTEKADVYSFGLMMWEMYTRVRAFKNMNPRWVAERIINDKVRPSLDNIDSWDTNYVNLMKECWDEDYVSRPMFGDILNRLEQMYDKEKTSTKQLGPYIIN